MQENIAVVSLKNIRYNWRAATKTLPARVKRYAVVKANAYGHGVLPVALAIEPMCDGFVVTSVAEGMYLRQGGAEKEILALTPPLDEEDVFRAATHGLTLTVCDRGSAVVAARAAEKFGLVLRVHLKADSGMNRLGTCRNSFRRICHFFKGNEHVRVEGVYSHLYRPSDENAATEQLRRFLREKEEAEDAFGRVTAHIAASGGVLLGEPFWLDGVRVGILLYGYAPDGLEERAAGLKLRPAMKLYTHVLQSHAFTGGGIGYASAEKAYDFVTVCRLGYADGFARKGGALNAEGNLCMDGLVFAGRSRRGARKLVFGDAAAEAKREGTIPYEILCRAGGRACFEYR